jgi:hypothetical protein
MQERAFQRKLNHAQRADWTREPVTEAAHVDPQQAAKNDSDGRLVRNDEDVSIRKLLIDFINDAQAAPGYASTGASPAFVECHLCQTYQMQSNRE